MKNVLIVEDDENLRSLLVDILKQKLSLNVAEASCADEAIQLLATGNTYNLIVSDYNMPNGDGKKLQNYLVDTDNASQFIFYSSQIDIVPNATHLYFIGLIVKPNMEILLDKIAGLCPEA